MNKTTLYITKGLPGSGKSTWAREFVDKSNGQVLNICKDDLRAMLNNKHHSKHREQYIQKIRDMITIDALENGYSVIWSDTNLHPIHHERALEISKNLKSNFKVVDFTNVDIETCISQDLKRFDSVGEKVIRDNYRKYLKPLVDKINQDKSLPKAIICDLDGTLADILNRNPYDASTCENDGLNEAVGNVLKLYFEKEYKILLVSGRKDEYKEPTLRWLKKHKIPFNELLMRQTKDMRKDSVIKKEIYEEFIKDKYYIEFILDDRPQVIRMWRDIGLTVFQLNDEEF